MATYTSGDRRLLRDQIQYKSVENSYDHRSQKCRLVQSLSYAILSISLFTACIGRDEKSDAYGNFEAVEIMVSAEGNGRLLVFEVEEGDLLGQGQVVGTIDTIQLALKKDQLKASINALDAKTQDVNVQIDVLEKRRTNLVREKKRIESLLKDEAATSKQLDDINGELDVVTRQITATRSQLMAGNRGILSEKKPLQIQVEQIEDQILKCKVTNPIQGTVLTKYAEKGEVVTFGKPLYKVGDLSQITLRAYVSGGQLSELKIGEDVGVLIDLGKEEMKEYPGTVTWVSSSAEFTPKIVQTKEERVNMVYAFKVNVKNDGAIKIGMPGEVRFIASNN